MHGRCILLELLLIPDDGPDGDPKSHIPAIVCDVAAMCRFVEELPWTVIQVMLVMVEDKVVYDDPALTLLVRDGVMPNRLCNGCIV